MIPLLDLVAQYRTIQKEINQAICTVLETGQFIMGPEVAALEGEIAAYLGTGHGIGVASGTDALLLVLRALDIASEDEVILPAYSFFATVSTILMVGAKPVFVDIDPKTYCLDVEQVARNITKRTKAVIPVHLYGHPANMEAVLDLGRTYDLKIIEDNAQGFGASYNGRKTGSLGHVGCLSFFPSKNLGGYGDGGMVVTNDARLAERVRILRTHGWKRKYSPLELGYNSRLDTIQAAILRVKLRYLDQWNERRRELAQRYIECLSYLGIGLPLEVPPGKHVFHLFVLRLKDRDRVRTRLKDDGVASEVYYPYPLHLTEPCQHLGYREGSFPIAEHASRETLAIPLYPEMTDIQFQACVNALVNSLKV